MDLRIDLRALLLLIGIFLSVIMAIAFVIKSKKRLANVWFTGFLIASAVVFVVKFLYSSGQIVHYPHWFKLNYPAGILRPAFFYLYISYLLNETTKFKFKDLVHFVPFLILSIYLLPIFLMGTAYKEDVLYGNISSTIGIVPGWYVLFQFIYSIGYLLLVFFSFKTYVRKNPRPNRNKKLKVRWIRLILYASILFILVAFFTRVTEVNGNFNLYLYDVYSILLILLCIRLMTLPEIVSSDSGAISKYENSSLSSKDIIDAFDRITVLMSEKHFYKRKDLKLIEIARELGLPAHQISQIINETTGNSFADFINGFRVEEAKKNLLVLHDKYTIEGIGQEAGFKSRASFYTAFKKHTNLTPSQFLKK